MAEEKKSWLDNFSVFDNFVIDTITPKNTVDKLWDNFTNPEHANKSVYDKISDSVFSNIAGGVGKVSAELANIGRLGRTTEAVVSNVLSAGEAHAAGINDGEYTPPEKPQASTVKDTGSPQVDAVFAAIDELREAHKEASKPNVSVKATLRAADSQWALANELKKLDSNKDAVADTHIAGIVEQIEQLDGNLNEDIQRYTQSLKSSDQYKSAGKSVNEKIQDLPAMVAASNAVMEEDNSIKTQEGKELYNKTVVDIRNTVSEIAGLANSFSLEELQTAKDAIDSYKIYGDDLTPEMQSNFDTLQAAYEQKANVAAKQKDDPVSESQEIDQSIGNTAQDTSQSKETKPPQEFGLGHAGEDVLMIQQALNKNGAKLNEDSILGHETEAAIREFQTKHNIVVDGIVGEETLTKILETRGIAFNEEGVPVAKNTSGGTPNEEEQVVNNPSQDIPKMEVSDVTANEQTTPTPIDPSILEKLASKDQRVI